ncbi:MAG: WD40 repeat domain-containing serine/threonine protein kinase [Candidatus Xenobia bacterium]
MLAPGTVLQSRYTVEDVLGRGGMGAVYRARDNTLGDRAVAIKAMQAQFEDAEERRRAVEQFRSEARLLATLDHPNIVPVMHSFEENDQHYLVMLFIDGVPLDKVIKAGAPLPMEWILAWAEQICDALEYLHGHEPPIIFRDLKPANVMVDARQRVRLIDFGIARLLTVSTNTLVKGAGTPGFAPMEQYGSTSSTDPRSDVYALGATLYTMLTGEVPPMPMEVLVGTREMKAPGELRGDVPVWLSGLVMQMLALHPDQRPQTVGEVRQVLRGPVLPMRDLPALLVVPPPPDMTEIATRVCPTCRGPILTATGTCSSCAPPRRRRHAEQRAAPVDFVPHGNLLAFAEGNDVCLWDVAASRAVARLPMPAPVWALAFAPDGQTLVVSAGQPVVWDVARLSASRQLEGHEADVLSVAFSTQGTMLATGSADHNVALWDMVTGRLLCRLPGHTDMVWAVAFSPDGRLVASASQDRTVRLWTAPEGRVVRVLEGHTDWVWDVSFSPDGRALASASFDRTVRFWSVERRIFGGGSRSVSFGTQLVSVRFAPLGIPHLAVGGWDGAVRIWDRRKERETNRLEGHEGAVGSLAWSPDGRLLAVAPLAGPVRLWDAHQGWAFTVCE